MPVPTAPSPGTLVDLNYARQLAQNFVEQKLTPGTILKDDTQAVWFSTEALLSILGVAPGSASSEISGVRIYFGAYKEEPGYPDNTANQNKMTLVLVTTGMETMEVMRGSVLETAYLDVIEGDKTTPPSYPTSGSPAKGKAYMNEGQLVPPPGDAKGLGLLDW